MAKQIASLVKRWSEKIRPPFSTSRQSGSKLSRSRQIVLSVSRSHAFLITIRRFKTAKENRAKTYKQLVLPLGILPGKTKEIAIRYKKHRLPALELSLAQAASTGLVVAGISGATYFGWQIKQTNASPPPVESISLPVPSEKVEDNQNKAESESANLPPSRPVHLNIPGLKIDTSVITVGQQSDGTMETPSPYSEKAGWYQLGPTPGEIGPAIIVGHVGNRNGPSIFWHLSKATPGMEVEVARKDGSTAKFRVTRVEQFDQDTFPTEKVYGNIDNAGLRLITCGGSFDREADRYTHNTVVFAELASVPLES